LSTNQINVVIPDKLSVSKHRQCCLYRLFKLGSSCSSYDYDSAAFLFSLVNKPGWQPLKLDQTGQYSYGRNSIYSCSSYGPTFGGGHDIHIANNAGSSTSSYSNLETPTARHLATAMDPPSHNHSWRVLITTSDLTKSKSSMKLPEEIVNLAILVLHTLFSRLN